MNHMVAENIASITEYKERIGDIKKLVGWFKYINPKMSEELLGYIPEIQKKINALEDELKKIRR